MRSHVNIRILKHLNLCWIVFSAFCALGDSGISSLVCKVSSKREKKYYVCHVQIRYRLKRWRSKYFNPRARHSFSLDNVVERTSERANRDEKVRWQSSLMLAFAVRCDNPLVTGDDVQTSLNDFIFFVFFWLCRMQKNISFVSQWHQHTHKF